jgi:uncharacterized Zn finger protein
MSIPGLTKATIQAHTAEGSFQRGLDYYEKGAVQHIENSEQTITARVKGSYYIPYAVHVSYDRQGVTDVECTCPYFEGSWCKHVVATLMVVLDEEGSSAVSTPNVQDRLEPLSKDDLIVVIEELIGMDDHPVQRLERALKAVRNTSSD